MAKAHRGRKRDKLPRPPTEEQLFAKDWDAFCTKMILYGTAIIEVNGRRIRVVNTEPVPPEIFDRINES